jgi:hypothetical protein
MPAAGIASVWPGSHANLTLEDGFSSDHRQAIGEKCRYRRETAPALACTVAITRRPDTKQKVTDLLGYYFGGRTAKPHRAWDSLPR